MKKICLCLILVFLAADAVALIQTAIAEPIFSDDFNDVNAQGWTPQQGTWTVADGYYSPRAQPGNSISTIQTSLTDYTLETKFKFNDSVSFRAGIIFRYLNASQYYSFELSNDFDVIIFCKYLPSNPSYGTQDATWAAANRITPPPQTYFTPGTIKNDIEYTLKVVVSGNTFTGYLTGGGLSETLVWSDDSYTTGTVGLRTRFAEVSFDYFKLSDADSPNIGNIWLLPTAVGLIVAVGIVLCVAVVKIRKKTLKSENRQVVSINSK
jgi:pectate lyase